MAKYIIYSRKSSEAEDRQVLSIESQINELTHLAERDEIKLDKIFQESKTAKAPGRPVFDAMMRYIEKNGNCTLVVWKLDRLARNAFDGGKISWFMDRGLITEIRTPEKSFKNNSDDKFMMSLDFGIAKKYVDDLSVNVKRGNRAKLEKGGWPGHAPLGYLNNKLDKSIIVDQERAPFVARLFQLYATGGYSVKEVTNILFSEGLRTFTGRKVSKSIIHFVISNPFYYGVMISHDKYYQGNHQPIINKELFDRANDVLFGRQHSKKQKHLFPLRGFMVCDQCGCALTATKKKGHNYYYCTNGKGSCEQHKTYLRQEKIEELMSDIFFKLQFDQELVEIAYLAAKEKLKQQDTFLDASIQNLLNQANLIKQRQDKLLDSYLSELIPKAVYEEKMAQLNNDRVSLETQLKNLQQKEKEGQSTLERAKNIFLKASLAKKEFLNSDDLKKRKIIETLLWNLSIKNQEISSFKLKMPYQLLVEAPLERDFSMMLPGPDSNRRPID